MKKNSILRKTIFALLIVAFALSLFFFNKYHENKNNKEHDAYEKQIKNYKQIDLQIYLSLPIYEDYINLKKQRLLRKHLLADHLKTASLLETPSIRDQTHLQSLFKTGSLVQIKQDYNTPWYFFNVRKQYRYLTPNTKKGLIELSERFNFKIKSRLKKKFKTKANTDFTIKFAISSVTRPESYQRSLRGRNANAASISSHSYGISFDLFYDEYYLYRDISHLNLAWPLLKQSKNILGFSIGRARRRQLRAMLAETLLELQAEGKLYAIWEKNQRCYHVTILANPGASLN